MLRNRNIDIPSCEDCEKRGGSLFCKLNHDELGILSKNKAHTLYKKGQIIFYEGNQPHGLYCIYNGKVKVHKLGEEGKEQIVRFAKEGNILGYRALLSGDSYSATATAIEDTLICHISKTDFFDVLEQNQDLSLKTIQMLTNDLKQSEQKILNMAQKPVKERIAEALLMLKECFGLDETTSIINASLTRREIGDIAGATTETTIRILSEFNKEEIIKLEGKKIKINRLNDLILTANIVD